MKKPESICIFGDSTSWGAWDMEKGGWVNRLWLSVANNTEYVTIYNLGIDGGTSETLLARFEHEAKARGADALIFQTGGNDASTDSAGNAVVSLEDFRKNIEELIRRAKTITAHIIFTDLKNCDESKTTPVSWMDRYCRNDALDTYRGVLQEVCTKNEVLYMDMPLLENSDFEDGLHPNAKGHEKIFSTVQSFLMSVGWL